MSSKKLTTYHWVLFATCFLATAFAGTVSTLMSVYLPVAVKDLPGKHPGQSIDSISAYVNAVFILGGAVGGMLAGWLSDRTGRKKALVFSIACIGISTVLTGYMPSWWEVVACRFVTGAGVSAVLVTTATLLMEEWEPESRAIIMGIVSIAFPVGIISAGTIDLLVSSWRDAFLVGLLPCLLAIVSVYFLRESASWQSHRIQVKNSEAKTIARQGIRPDILKGSLVFGSMLIGLWAVFSWLPTWIQSLVKTGDAQAERGISMLLLGIGGLAGGIASGWIGNALGLRRSMLICFGAAAICSVMLFSMHGPVGLLVYTAIGIIAVAFGISQGVLSVYIPLLFPVSVRGSATGFCFNIGRFVTAAAVLSVGMLVTSLGGYGNALFIFSLVFFIGFATLFFSKETGKTSVLK